MHIFSHISYLKNTFHFIYQPLFLLSPFSHYTISPFSMPYLLLKGCKAFIGSQQGLKYQLKAGLNSSPHIKPEEVILPLGMVSKKLVHTPGIGPCVTFRVSS